MNRLFLIVAALSLCAFPAWSQVAFPQRINNGNTGTFYQWEFTSGVATGGAFGVSSCPVASISFEQATDADVTVFACPTINPTSSSECVSKKAYTASDIDGETITTGAPYLVPFVISAETSGTSRLNMHCTSVAKAPGGGTFDGNASDISFSSPVGDDADVETWANNTEAALATAGAPISFDKIVRIDTAATAGADFASAIEEYMDGTTTGPRNVKFEFALTGAEALDDSDCYDDGGDWNTRGCFVAHPQTTGSYNGSFPDSIGADTAGAAITNLSADLQLVLHMEGSIEIGNASQTKNVCLFSFGNQYFAGRTTGPSTNYGLTNGALHVAGEVVVDQTAQEDGGRDGHSIGGPTGTARVNGTSVSSFSPLCTQGMTDGDMSDFTLHVSGLDDDDVAWTDIDSFGVHPPTIIGINGNSGIGVQLLGAMNWASPWRGHLKSFDWAVVLGSPYGAGESPYASNCDTGTCTVQGGNFTRGTKWSGLIQGGNAFVVDFDAVRDHNFSENYFECGISCSFGAFVHKPRICSLTGSDDDEKGMPALDDTICATNAAEDVPNIDDANLWTAFHYGPSRLPENDNSFVISGGFAYPFHLGNDCDSNQRIIVNQGSHLGIDSVDLKTFYAKPSATCGFVPISATIEDGGSHPAYAGLAPSSAGAYFVNVRDFGALPDGTTNNEDAFNDAATVACASTGARNMFVPAGDYGLGRTGANRVFSGLRVTCDDFTLFGEGEATRLQIIGDNGNYAVYWCSDFATPDPAVNKVCSTEVKNFTMRDLVIEDLDAVAHGHSQFIIVDDGTVSGGTPAFDDQVTWTGGTGQIQDYTGTQLYIDVLTGTFGATEDVTDGTWTATGATLVEGVTTEGSHGFGTKLFRGLLIENVSFYGIGDESVDLAAETSEFTLNNIRAYNCGADAGEGAGCVAVGSGSTGRIIGGTFTGGGASVAQTGGIITIASIAASAGETNVEIMGVHLLEDGATEVDRIENGLIVAPNATGSPINVHMSDSVIDHQFASDGGDAVNTSATNSDATIKLSNVKIFGTINAAIAHRVELSNVTLFDRSSPTSGTSIFGVDQVTGGEYDSVGSDAIRTFYNAEEGITITGATIRGGKNEAITIDTGGTYNIIQGNRFDQCGDGQTGDDAVQERGGSDFNMVVNNVSTNPSASGGCNFNVGQLFTTEGCIDGAATGGGAGSVCGGNIVEP